MGTEVKNSYAGCIAFDAVSREFTVPIPATKDLLDIQLALYALPGMGPALTTPANKGAGAAFSTPPGQDFWGFLHRPGGYAAIRPEIKKLISVVPSDRLRAQYLRGAQSYLAMARSLHALNQGDEDA